MYNTILTLSRWLLVVIAFWQAIGLLSTLFWLTQPDFVAHEIEAFFIIKVGAILICGIIYYLLNKFAKNK